MLFLQIASDAMIRREVTPALKEAEAAIIKATNATGDALSAAMAGKNWDHWEGALNCLIADLAPFFRTESTAGAQVGEMFCHVRMQGNQAIKNADHVWRKDAERALRSIRLRTIRYVATGS